MLRSIWLALVLGLVCVTPGFADAAAAPSVEAYFTGKLVTAKIDMPGSEKGVDLDFDKATPLDWKEYSSRLTTYGVAIRKGQTAQITKIAVKKDHIEFQLDGGGYGTLGDSTDTKVKPKNVEKSAYEKDLEKQLSKTKDPAAREPIEQNLDKEVAKRQRAQADAVAAAQSATAVKEKELAEKRRRGGSRLNLRFKKVVPPDDLNSDAVMKLLADYVDFSDAAPASALVPVAQVGGNVALRQPVPGGAQGSAASGLQRGMKTDEVAKLLGAGSLVSQTTSPDGMTTQVMNYTTTENTVDATFVEGVMVKYTVRSK